MKQGDFVTLKTDPTKKEYQITARLSRFGFVTWEISSGTESFWVHSKQIELLTKRKVGF